MLHLSGMRCRKDAFSVHPDLTTSLAVHNAWLTLELPVEGLHGLHTHIHAELMLGSPAISLWEMRMLWETFPHTSDIVRAMGLNFVQACVDMVYRPRESLEMQAWFQSTPELFLFFKELQATMPIDRDNEEAFVPVGEEKEKIIGTVYQTIGKKAGKAIKTAVAAQANKQVEIMEKGMTRKVSPQERHAREQDDFEALRTRLRRTRSDDSLRSVDTIIWDPQTSEEDEAADMQAVSDDMDDSDNYVGGSFSDALVRSLETIRLRRETRLAKNKSWVQLPEEELTSANMEQHVAKALPAFITE